MARLPIRMRLTIAFAGVIAVMLAAAGVLMYAQFDRDLDDAIDSGLDARATDVEVLARRESAAGKLLADSGERYAQAYARDGRVLAATRRAAGRRMLSPADVRRVAGRPLVGDRKLPEGAGRVRAVSARTRAGALVIVAVAEPLARTDSELDRLLELLLIALPFALLLASFAGYEVAGSALRPVERMRTRAEEITEHDLAERLPLPGSDDEVERLGATLNQMLGRLEAALARERRLVADASHELRTPLSVLRTEVDLALKGERDPAELRAALASVGEEVDRLSRLADDLLVLAREDREGLPLTPEPRDSAELLDAAAGRLRSAAEAEGRRVEAAADGSPAVLADAGRVAQALDNLGTNALVHGAGTISLSACRAGDRVELHVTDEGGGFPEAFLDRAFERFSRAGGRDDDAGGTGLGLSIVAAVAAAHGGRAGAANREGRGADVWIALPAAPPQAPLRR